MITEDPAKLVAKASLMYMNDAGVYHVINLARRIVDQLSAGGRGSSADPELVAALTVVLLDQNRVERSGVVENAELDASRGAPSCPRLAWAAPLGQDKGHA